ncbi:hypothetical protein BRADI_1g66731v3 [Brachypodium distachyon]|uniref:ROTUNDIFOLIA like 8 n=2 Tax=Brachypodium distachyon TaxID=15368 RepID=A0A0Q3HHV9_BRADI|nr:hypothetical protein BRADI_1g66731v3 [Brachypodium distachyon]
MVLTCFFSYQSPSPSPPASPVINSADSLSLRPPHSPPFLSPPLHPTKQAHLREEEATNRSMEFYVDEKWKFSKKSRNNGSRRVPGGGGGDPFLKRSASTRDQVIGRRAGAAGAASSAGGCAAPSFSSRCAGLVKEQRARFYIMRRCVTMLVCWKDCS